MWVKLKHGRKEVVFVSAYGLRYEEEVEGPLQFLRIDRKIGRFHLKLCGRNSTADCLYSDFSKYNRSYQGNGTKEMEFIVEIEYFSK